MIMSEIDVINQCKTWFTDIVDMAEHLTTGNVAHKRKMISGYAKGCIEFLNEQIDKLENKPLI